MQNVYVYPSSSLKLWYNFIAPVGEMEELCHKRQMSKIMNKHFFLRNTNLNYFVNSFPTSLNSFCLLWQPCLLMDRDEMSTLYRGPTIDVSYQVSVHLAKRFHRRRFF